MPEAHAASYKLNPFDVTRVWPHSDYPRIRVGEVVLNRNPLNYFADVEQAAFAPSACTIIAMVAFGSMVMVAVHFSKADKEYGAQVEAGLARAKPGDPRQVSVVK